MFTICEGVYSQCFRDQFFQYIKQLLSEIHIQYVLLFHRTEKLAQFEFRMSLAAYFAYEYYFLSTEEHASCGSRAHNNILW
jgi:hypothetical protein